MTITIEEFRTFFCDRKTTKKHYGTTVYYGFSYGLDLMGVMKRIPPDFQVAWGWCSEPYRMVWIGFENRAIITFCEGDVDMSIAPDNEAFTRDRLQARQFYGNPRNLDSDFLEMGDAQDRIDPEGDVMAEDTVFEQIRRAIAPEIPESLKDEDWFNDFNNPGSHWHY